MSTADLVTFTTGMFVILNPIGNVAVFAGMVADGSETYKRSVAIQSSIAVAVILIASVWMGDLILKFFNIDIPSFRVAGGIMIALISMSMLMSKKNAIHSSKNGQTSSPSPSDIAIVPLAMPMVAGPGAMVTVIVFSNQYSGTKAHIEMSIVCVILAAILCFGYLVSGRITKLMGAKGMDLITKLMGMILLAIAVGMLATGLKALFPGWAGVAGN